MATAQIYRQDPHCPTKIHHFDFLCQTYSQINGRHVSVSIDMMDSGYISLLSVSDWVSGVTARKVLTRRYVAPITTYYNSVQEALS